MHHELWGDELHSWNIAKASGSFFDLISNTRYEGHPPVWYTILWLISKFTHNLAYVQAVHGTIAVLSAFMLLFFSPLSVLTKALIPFGYYFLYEYSVIDRNYAIAVLIVFCICLILHRNFKHRILIYYVLLFLLCNTHLIALLLGVSIHLYFLLLKIEHGERKWQLAWHVVLGGLIFLSALSFIFPPADSELNMQFWMDRWRPDQIKAISQIPLRAFVPIPAWWNEHFWNTQFLLEAKVRFYVLKFINVLVAGLLLAITIVLLRKDKKALWLYLTNTVVTFIIIITLFPLGTARYSGFMVIGFIVAYWLSCYQNQRARDSRLWYMLLAFQIIGGVFVVAKDARLPFSNASRIKELLAEVPKNEKTVTDYWTLDIISGYADESFFCVDLQKQRSFVLWDKHLLRTLNAPNCYYYGVNRLLQNEKMAQLYFLTTLSPEKLDKIDSKLVSSFSVALVDKREGAIEKGSNLYLYKISEL